MRDDMTLDADGSAPNPCDEDDTCPDCGEPVEDECLTSCTCARCADEAAKRRRSTGRNTLHKEAV